MITLNPRSIGIVKSFIPSYLNSLEGPEKNFKHFPHFMDSFLSATFLVWWEDFPCWRKFFKFFKGFWLYYKVAKNWCFSGLKVKCFGWAFLKVVEDISDRKISCCWPSWRPSRCPALPFAPGRCMAGRRPSSQQATVLRSLFTVPQVMYHVCHACHHVCYVFVCHTTRTMHAHRQTHMRGGCMGPLRCKTPPQLTTTTPYSLWIAPCLPSCLDLPWHRKQAKATTSLDWSHEELYQIPPVCV